MNVAFYVDNIADDNNGPIFDCMNHMVENNEVRDATLFYNDIGPEPKKPSFGVFNATEIWYFTGHVIATTIENWVALKNAVNKFKTKYLYKPKDGNIATLIMLANMSEIIVNSEEEQKEVYRLTGVKAPIVDNLNPKKLIEVLNEHV